MKTKKPLNALVLSGGGARGAYEAGALHYLRTKISPELEELSRFQIHCGTSVGAINSCFMASTCHDLVNQGQLIYKLWSEIEEREVYKSNFFSLGRLTLRTVAGIARNLLGKRFARKTERVLHFKGILDPSPLPKYLKKELPWRMIGRNLKNNLIHALCLTTTNMHTGRPELFIQKRPDCYYTGKDIHHYANINLVHAMASAALPMVFPSINIHGNYYGDGGLRMNTPISPALHLGADRVFVISLRYNLPQMEMKKPGAPPSVGDVAGRIINAIVLDHLESDVKQMERFNQIISWIEEVAGDDILERVETHLKQNYAGDNLRPPKKVEVFRLIPSQDMAEIFAECLVTERKNWFGSMTFTEKMIFRGLRLDEDHGKDLLSHIVILPSYLNRLLELGYEDAKSKHDEIVEFFTCPIR